MKIEVHPTYLEIVDADEETLALIDKAFSWDIPGFFFQQRNHKKKHPTKMAWCWACNSDGKKHLLEDNTLPLGFHNKLSDILSKSGVGFEIADMRPPKPEKQYDWHCSADLREYQSDIMLQPMLDEESGVVCAATGAGKSIVAAAAICELGLPSLIVVPTKLLLGQFLETIEQFTDIPVGMIGSGKYVEAPVQIAIAKSLVTADGVHPDLLTKDVLIIDEMHYSSAETWKQIITQCPAHYRYGFSATPYRDNELEDNMLVGMCGDVISKVGVQELQESGHLAQTDIRVIPIKCGYDRMVFDETDNLLGGVVGWRETTYAEKYRASIAQNRYRNEQIAKIVNHHVAQGHKVLVTVQFIEHADTLIPMFDGDVIFLSGQDTAKQTEAKRLEFSNSTGGVCIGTSIVDTGFNVPAIDVLVLVGGGEFDGRTVQRLGRGLRPTPGKDKVIVYDIKDDDRPMFWYHSKSRIKAYESVGQEVTEYETFDDVLAMEKREQKKLALRKTLKM